MLRISLNLARRGGLGWLCTLPLVLALGVQFASQAEVGPAQPDLASYRYPDADLGAAYSPAATQFKLWAPTATAVAVVLYADATQAATVTVPLQRSPTGIWSGSIAGDCQGKYYQYAITHPSTTDRPETLLVNDPYAHGTSVNSGRTLIFDSRQTDPPGWAADHPVVQAQNVDAVIYEIHTRDFTLHPSAGTAPDRRGKYLGLIQTGAKTPTGQATGLDHLVELGVTHVQLLPTYDFAAGNERQTAADYDWYSWGYDPLLYQNPEGSYASNPDDTSRQRELKQVVQSFHQHGLGVVLDVVFNHTAATGTGPASVFDKVYPGYFYRRDAAGHYVNGTGCGNELASEKPMVRKFIVDSIKYWLTEYHVDGFRFDLMGILDRETMLEVYREAKAINPSVMIYGEGWRMEPLLPAERMMTQDHVAGTGIAAFNDGIRDNIKGDNDAQALVSHLEAYPNDIDAREKLAHLYADFYGRVPLAVEQLQLLIALPNQPPRRVAEWLTRVSDMLARDASQLEEAKAALQEIVDRYPDTAQSAAAQARLSTLGRTVRAQARTSALKLGEYEQNIGLRQGIAKKAEPE